MDSPSSGCSYFPFRKAGCQPITIPKHEPIMKVYAELVRQVVESKMKNNEEGEFVVFYPDLLGCITSGDTIESAVANAVDAKEISE